ncbi:transglycosylase domain-containing protein [Catellatospora sichuanensis]|uniref:transglycosylase domain-containing protein n=1 Tax=Catellatospora sichuanensis TaxID=1969805 RepID=UPI0024825FF3|nr:transglycosylase domain-containing protein [Catellatospora sichuanensis]
MTTYGDDEPVIGRARPPAPPATGRAEAPRAGAPAPVAGREQASRAGVPSLAGRAGGAAQPVAEKKRSPRRRRALIAGMIGVAVVLSGVGLIAGTWFYSSVPRPEQLPLKENTEVLSVDGKAIAKLGAENRTLIQIGTLPEPVRNALIAGEDKNFYSHDGIDLAGIARAAWNNLTGGETQGASTITQQYARAAADDLEITYARKMREAVMARKLEDEYDKLEIAGFYLNTVYFGRGSYGVGAAAQAFFGKEAAKLTVAEAAVLGAVLRQPEPSDNHGGYDPQNSPEAAKARWGYVLDNMVEMGWLSATDRAAAAYPDQTLKAYKAGQNAGEWGYQDRGTGNVINYVGAEMRAWNVPDWRSGGYRITTSIDSRAQKALESQVYRAHQFERTCQTKEGKETCTETLKAAVDGKGTLLEGQPKNLMAAAVAIDPNSGRVIAYYGGNSGTGVDYAGRNAIGTEKEYGGHPPASSFKIYTLAAALEDGYSIKSHFDPTPLSKANGDPDNVQNAGRDNDASCGKFCTLEQMTVKSYNVPFYKITRDIGQDKVVDMARRAGVTTVWGTDGKPMRLAGAEAGRIKSTFGYQVGFGQYPITVLDHASGAATFAAHGVWRKPHFVVKVEKKDKDTGEWKPVDGLGEKVESRQAMRAEIADEVTSVLRQIPGAHALSGRQSAAKTGTWENGRLKPNGQKMFPGENAHAWFIGYTPQIATAVWVGNVREELPLRDRDKDKIGGSALPGQIWEQFMNDAHQAMNLKAQPLADGSDGNLGDPDRGDGASPAPSAAPSSAAPEPSTSCGPDQPCGGDPSPEPSPEPSPKPSPSTSPKPSPSPRRP